MRHPPPVPRLSCHSLLNHGGERTSPLRGGLLLSSARICLRLVDGLGLFSWTYPLSIFFLFS